MTPVTVRQWLNRAAAALPGDSPRLDAELLLSRALRRPRSWLFAHSDEPLDDASRRHAEALLARRRDGVPVAHLLGEREFWSLPLAVTADTLIPRPETERLVEQALLRLPVGGAARVLDLGTGSGAIAIAIARERPRASVVASDASGAALAVARANVARLAPGRVELRQGDWFTAVAGRHFDVIVSNPPYIAEGDRHLHRGDLRFEPRSALAAGRDGLDALGRICAGAGAHLEAGGWLIVEHGHGQGGVVRTLFQAAGFSGIETVRDLAGHERVSAGRWRAPGR